MLSLKYRLQSSQRRIARALADRLVDPAYYLARNPDVAAAGIDPVEHYASYWHCAPLRSPSARIEPWLFALSPIAALLLRFASRDRADILNYLRQRINDISGEDRGLQLKFCLAVARYLSKRPTPAVFDALGQPFHLARICTEKPDWIYVVPIAAEGTFEFREPPVVLSDRIGTLRQVPLPALWCATVQDASVFGSAEVIAENTFIIHEPAADPTLRLATRQCDFTTNCYSPLANKILARFPAATQTTLKEAVLLGGRARNNYFHFLIEYLTKGYVIEQFPQMNDLPLLVTADLHPQEMEALGQVLPGRPIIQRQPGTRIDVETLHLPSVMTYVPDDPTVPFWRSSAVNANSLHWLRNRVLAGHGEFRTRQTRIYLCRKGARNIINAQEVADTFVRHGFTLIDPAGLSFGEQVDLFRSATHIAGPIGAAFSNLVFASPGARILGIVSPFTVQFSLFASLARFAGCTYYALPGDGPGCPAGSTDKRKPLSVTHGSFPVDMVYLERALNLFTRDPA
ncbi:glycosyltransferase family 61 protein [Methylobacterium sp. A49B]